MNFMVHGSVHGTLYTIFVALCCVASHRRAAVQRRATAGRRAQRSSSSWTATRLLRLLLLPAAVLLPFGGPPRLYIYCSEIAERLCNRLKIGRQTAAQQGKILFFGSISKYDRPKIGTKND